MLEFSRKDWIDRERARFLAGNYAAESGLGIMAGTRIATAAGWSPVESLKAGDRVLTFGSGLQPLHWVEHRLFWCGGRADPGSWPLHVPARALGNPEEMYLMPAQSVVIDTDLAESAFGTPYVLMPAAALDGHFGATRQRPCGQIGLLRLGFEREEVVFANSGAMFHCGLHMEYFDEGKDRETGYVVLSEDAARDFLDRLTSGQRGHQRHN